MKGKVFQAPLEFSLEVQGESWNQGSTIRGSLAVKAHSSAAVPSDQIAVHLAHGQLKKVRAKSPDAFEIHSSRKGKESESWSFELDQNCPITDNSGSLFLLYGLGDATEKLGQLQLPINPHPLIQDVLELITTEFRFVVKSKKFSKGSVEVKLDPPSARAFATVEQLAILFHMDGENLGASYAFQLKKVEATASSIDMKKEKKTIEQIYSPANYRTPGGRFDDKSMGPLIKEVLSQVESKILL